MTRPAPIAQCVVILALACVSCTSLVTAQADSASVGLATREVLQVDEARRRAYLHGDVRALDSLFDDDLTIYWGDGTADDKASALALFRSHTLVYDTLAYDSTRVRVYGSTAVVTGRATIYGHAEGHELRSRAQITRVYVRRSGRWRLVAVQTTRVAER